MRKPEGHKQISHIAYRSNTTRSCIVQYSAPEDEQDILTVEVNATAYHLRTNLMMMDPPGAGDDFSVPGLRVTDGHRSGFAECLRRNGNIFAAG